MSLRQPSHRSGTIASAEARAMNTNRKINLSFAGGLAALALVALVSIFATQRLIQAANWVSHTHEVRSALRAFEARVGSAKSDVRSFLITGDSSYLRGYRAGVDSAEASFAALQRLARDNPSQQLLLRELRELLDERLVSFSRTIALGPRSTDLAAQLAQGERLSSRIGGAISAFDSIEATLLEARGAAERDSEQGVRFIVVAFALFGTALAWLMRRSIKLDLEKRTRVEHALKESEAKFSGILTIAADAIVTIDSAQTIRLFNHGAEQIFGYRENEVIGQSLELLLPTRIVSAHRDHVEEFSRSETTARRMGDRRQVWGRRKSGEEFPAEASISKLATSEGMLFTAVMRDVSEQRRLERHEHVLAEAGRRLIDTIEYEDVLGVIADLPVPEIADWCVVDVVETADERRVFRRIASGSGLSGEDGGALRVLELVAIDDDSASRVIDVMRSGKAELMADLDREWLEGHSEPDEYEALCSLGVWSLAIVPLVAAGESIGAMTVGLTGARRALNSADLDLLQALAARATLAFQNARSHAMARRAATVRDEVLSIVSHDLRNPLSAVLMCAHTLLETPPANEAERRKLYQSVSDAADWMHTLMQDLLDVASIEAGRLAIAAEPQSVAHMIEAGVDMLSRRAVAEGVTLVTAISTEMPTVNADAARILQVLSNLLSNAIKYSVGGGTVTVGATPHDSEVTLWVRDEGAGIAPEHLPHIFDRFWHLRGKSRTRGAGLGLAIAAGIVKAHGGRIWVESKLDVGSTFYFTLPVSASPRGPLGSASPVTRETSPTPAA